MNESTSLRSHLVGQLDLARVGLEVRLAAWVETIRDHGGLILLHLRDYSGRLQAVADPTRLDPEGWAVVERLHAEYCVAVSGKLVKRPKGPRRLLLWGWRGRRPQRYPRSDQFDGRSLQGFHDSRLGVSGTTSVSADVGLSDSHLERRPGASVGQVNLGAFSNEMIRAGAQIVGGVACQSGSDAFCADPSDIGDAITGCASCVKP